MMRPIVGSPVTVLIVLFFPAFFAFTQTLDKDLLVTDVGSYGSEATAGGDPGRWWIPDVLHTHLGWEDFVEGLGVEYLFITAARNVPNLRLYQVDHAYGSIQCFYLERTGNPDPDVLSLLRHSRNVIRSEIPEFRSYTIRGFRHTTLQQAYFYRYHVGGDRFRDWVAAIARGDDVDDIACGDGSE